MKQTTICILFIGCFITGWAKPVTPTDGSNARRKATAYYLQGLNKKYTGERTVAFDLLRKAVAVDSTLSGAHYELSMFYFAASNPVLGLDALQRATGQDSHNYWYRVMLGKAYEQFGLTAEAAQEYDTLRIQFPYKEEVIGMQADMFTRIDSFTMAIAAYDDLEQLRGANEGITLEKFKLFSRMGRKDSAFAEMNQLVDQAPMNARYRIVLGDLYLEQNDTAKAYSVYMDAKEIEPDNAYLFVSLSRYYAATGEPELSKKLIEDALVNENLDVATKLEILTAYLREWYAKTGDIAPAYHLFETLLEQHPQQVELFSIYAGFLTTQDRKVDAIDYLEIAVGISPTTLEYWMQLIGLNMELERFGQAVIICEQAKEYFPESAELQYYKGAAYFQQKKYIEALEAYRTGLRHVPTTNPSFASNLYGQIGDTYQMLDEMESCYEAYETALTLNPKNIVILNNYAYFLSLKKKDLGKAERMSGKCVELEPQNSTYLDTYAWIYFMQGQYSLAKFYMEQAITHGGAESDVVVEHYGDVLFMTGDVGGALEQWDKSLELGNTSKVLKEKIKTKTYIEQ